MASSCPVGIFDSGVGGLSILDNIHQLMPNEKLLYVADSAHAPYGHNTEDVIRQRCLAIMDFFLQQNVKAVVLACNTATAVAVALLREKYPLPVIAVEPAIKPAAQQSRSAVVGVLATAGTIDSDKFLNLKSQFAKQVEIITRACPGLVEQIECLVSDSSEIKELLHKFIDPMIQKGVDTLVLGCTHYSLITELIAEVAGPDVMIMDTDFAVARELQRRLQENDLENMDSTNAPVEFYSSGSIEDQQALISRYWGKPVQVSAFPPGL